MPRRKVLHLLFPMSYDTTKAPGEMRQSDQIAPFRHYPPPSCAKLALPGFSVSKIPIFFGRIARHFTPCEGRGFDPSLAAPMTKTDSIALERFQPSRTGDAVMKNLVRTEIFLVFPGKISSLEVPRPSEMTSGADVAILRCSWIPFPPISSPSFRELTPNLFKVPSNATQPEFRS